MDLRSKGLTLGRVGLLWVNHKVRLQYLYDFLKPSAYNSYQLGERVAIYVYTALAIAYVLRSLGCPTLT